MKLRPLPLLMILCVLAFGFGLLLFSEAPPEEPEASQNDREASASMAANTEPGSPTSALSAPQRALLDDPRTLAFEHRLDFQTDVRHFFDQADQLSEEQLKARSEALEAELAEYEKTNEVSAAESLMLQLALVKTTVGDESAQQQAMAELIDEYKARSQVREAEWRSQPKPEFEAYKRQEKAIVEEVMAMERIPGDVDRNEYLRQKLMEARIEAAGNDGMD